MIILALESSGCWNTAETLGKAAPFPFSTFSEEVKALLLLQQVLYPGESSLTGEVCPNGCTVWLYELTVMITIISLVFSIIHDY